MVVLFLFFRLTCTLKSTHLFPLDGFPYQYHRHKSWDPPDLSVGWIYGGEDCLVFSLVVQTNFDKEQKDEYKNNNKSLDGHSNFKLKVAKREMSMNL